MTIHRPFAFEREFTDRQTNDTAAIELAAALVEAEARGFAAGEQAALQRCRAEREAAVQATLSAIVTALHDIDDHAQRIAGDLEEQATQLALVAAELLAGQRMADQPAGAVTEMLGRLLGELRRGVPLELWVHPELVAEVERQVADHQRGERRQRTVTVKADPALPAGDARVRWQGGGAMVEAASRRTALERAFADMMRAR